MQEGVTKEETNKTYFVFQRSKQVGNEPRAVPSPRPCFHFKSSVYAVELPNACASQGTPSSQCAPEAQRARDPRDRLRRPLGATWHHGCCCHTPPGHPLVTSGARPPADNCSDECPEARAPGVLRFKVGSALRPEPRSQHYSAHERSHTI